MKAISQLCGSSSMLLLLLIPLAWGVGSEKNSTVATTTTTVAALQIPVGTETSKSSDLTTGQTVSKSINSTSSTILVQEASNVADKAKSGGISDKGSPTGTQGAGKNSSTSSTSSTTSTTSTTTTSKPTIKSTTTTPAPPPKKPKTLHSTDGQTDAKPQPPQPLPPAADSAQPEVQSSQERTEIGGNLVDRAGGNVYIVPIVTVLLTVPLAIGVVTIMYRRLRELWSTRHYSRMDFLVDGMYND